MPQAVYILFGAGFTVAVTGALGLLLLRGLRVRLARQEEPVLGFLCGAPLLSLLVFGCCTLGVARKGVFLGLGLAALAGGWWMRRRTPACETELEAVPVLWKRFFLVLFSVFFLLYFFNAMAPEISPDGSSYHLGLVARYLQHHGFYRITTDMYAALSQGVEMLFLFAFAFGRHSAAALVHLSFLVALVLAMVCWGRRAGMPGAGVAGALFVFVSPVVGIDAASAYNDVAVAAVAFGVFYLVQIWSAERTPALLVAIGLLAGFGYAVKYTAGVLIPYALAVVAWKSWRKRQPVAAPLLVAGLCAAVSVAPWMLKNWIWMQNPVSPLFNAVFPNPYVTVGFERQYTEFLRLYELKSRLEIPLQVTLKGDLAGIFGPLFLLAPVALLALRQRLGRQLLLAALPFGITYFGNIGTRFLIPAVPFVALAMAMELARARWLAPALVVAHGILSWPSVMPLYCGQNAWRLAKVPFREALRIKKEEDFLHSNLPNYDIARVVERMVPAGAKVLVYSQLATAYTTRDVRVVYQSASNRIAGDILFMPLIEDYPPNWWLDFHFAARPLRRIRAVQTARAEPDNWSIAEFRIFSRGRELARAPEWRLRARPNPWYVQLAFDNSLVTRWSSAQTIYPGMSVEVDFGRPETLDAVRLECSHDQWKVRVKLEGQDASGNWQPLAAAPELREGPPILGLRRQATQELKLRGIDYVAIDGGDFGAADFRDKAELWGLEFVGQGREMRLYRIL